MASSNVYSCLLLVVGLGCFGFGCAAPRGATQLPLTTPERSLQELTSLSGVSFDLTRTIKQHKATVLFWWSTRCPCVKRYQTRMEHLQTHFGKRQVALLAVASNAGDTPLRIQKVATKRHFRLPIVHDPGGRLARFLGVRSTPAVVLLDRGGKVRYAGWIDNERRLGQSGRRAYLRSALEAVLVGQKVTRKRTTMLGCDITRSLFGAAIKQPPKAPPKAHHTHKQAPPPPCDCQDKPSAPKPAPKSSLK